MTNDTATSTTRPAAPGCCPCLGEVLRQLPELHVRPEHAAEAVREARAGYPVPGRYTPILDALERRCRRRRGYAIDGRDQVLLADERPGADR